MNETKDWRDMDRWGEGEDRPTPAQVQAQLTGTGAGPSDSLMDEVLGELVSDRPVPTTWEETDGVTFLDMEYSDSVYRGERCPTCGRNVLRKTIGDDSLPSWGPSGCTRPRARHWGEPRFATRPHTKRWCR